MSQTPRYLALDLGTQTGWAISEGNRIVDSGVRDFKLKSSEHIGNRGIRFYNFLLTLGQPDVIFYEKVQFMGNRKCGDGGELYKGLLMIMNMFAAGFNIETIGVHPMTLKKSFTGSGVADKVIMCEKAREYGWQGGMSGTALLDDEADAIALIITQMRERYGIQARL